MISKLIVVKFPTRAAWCPTTLCATALRSIRRRRAGFRLPVVAQLPIIIYCTDRPLHRSIIGGHLHKHLLLRDKFIIYPEITSSQIMN